MADRSFVNTKLASDSGVIHAAASPLRPPLARESSDAHLRYRYGGKPCGDKKSGLSGPADFADISHCGH